MRVSDAPVERHETEQVCDYRAVLRTDHHGRLAELVDEHRVVQVGHVALAPELPLLAGYRDEVLDGGAADGVAHYVPVPVNVTAT